MGSSRYKKAELLSDLRPSVLFVAYPRSSSKSETNFNPGIGLKFIGNEASIACHQSDGDSSTGLGDLLNLINKRAMHAINKFGDED
ncbi:hypothetical protein [Streptococcus sp. NLN64]|uniref:hypothetical protein n=1 Tax=Streptococcus sp. NLN64 TaxID=2822799 RepID=UPI0018CAC0C9|nr:hypothetical protein [Streptococcus sp. NLN64]MBG9367839.1 hypothetical protein [Streptococcus sp. NLN64]